MDIVIQLLSNLKIPMIYGLICLPIPMIMGVLWYGPICGKAWMRAVGKTEDELTMGAGLIIGTAVIWFISSSVSALGVYILTYSPLGAFAIEDGQIALFVIVAFVLATFAYLGYGLNHIVMAKNYQGQPMSLTMIDFGYQYICFAILAIVQALLMYYGILLG